MKHTMIVHSRGNLFWFMLKWKTYCYTIGNLLARIFSMHNDTRLSRQAWKQKKEQGCLVHCTSVIEPLYNCLHMITWEGATVHIAHLCYVLHIAWCQHSLKKNHLKELCQKWRINMVPTFVPFRAVPEMAKKAYRYPGPHTEIGGSTAETAGAAILNFF